jgi:hypothetical protein
MEVEGKAVVVGEGKARRLGPARKTLGAVVHMEAEPRPSNLGQDVLTVPRIHHGLSFVAEWASTKLGPCF